MKSLVAMVKDKKVYFSHYQNNELWYSTECGFMFPVPVADTGNAEFKQEDKATFFMRWIRKHLEMIENERVQFE
ncbi:hypothetical protein [Yersinia phage fHe-Yen9-04]|uniref:Uncharacterized protein n=1 Tax=Yersinia phage fHe-Yen9-04 TaxID=2052742 RepID=A0A2C9D0A2_9CAUD|nr:hypothetical protein FDJ41_gp448 [Yersinia phage fHe-Yen9-04]SOK58732.1 hypothetical protein [Yersinia phage fHe-Yen9-04]VUE36501.1 hypothetical protein [Yersinia phage fHe-Yen9-04]